MMPTSGLREVRLGDLGFIVLWLRSLCMQIHCEDGFYAYSYTSARTSPRGFWPLWTI